MLSADLPAAVGPTTATTVRPVARHAGSRSPRSRRRRRAPSGGSSSPRQSPPVARTAPASTCQAPGRRPAARADRAGSRSSRAVGVGVGQGAGHARRRTPRRAGRRSPGAFAPRQADPSPITSSAARGPSAAERRARARRTRPGTRRPRRDRASRRQLGAVTRPSSQAPTVRLSGSALAAGAVHLPQPHDRSRPYGAQGAASRRREVGRSSGPAPTSDDHLGPAASSRGDGGVAGGAEVVQLGRGARRPPRARAAADAGRRRRRQWHGRHTVTGGLARVRSRGDRSRSSGSRRVRTPYGHGRRQALDAAPGSHL